MRDILACLEVDELGNLENLIINFGDLEEDLLGLVRWKPGSLLRLYVLFLTSLALPDTQSRCCRLDWSISLLILIISTTVNSVHLIYHVFEMVRHMVRLPFT